MVRFSACALVLTFTLVACGAVPDIHFEDAGSTSPTNPTSSGGTSGSSGTVADDAGSSKDGSTDDGSTRTCTPTGPEICDDHIDNDCNGKTDCEDPACKTSDHCRTPGSSGSSGGAG